VRASVAVAVPPAEAFEIFTSEIDRWWRRGPKFRAAGAQGGFIRLEPGVGGRLYESIDSPTGPQVFEVGCVRVWQPPSRLAFSWRNANFSPTEITEVDIDFTASAAGTLITLTHRGWNRLRADHPVRHGLDSTQFARMLGLWWGEQLSSLRLGAQQLQ